MMKKGFWYAAGRTWARMGSFGQALTFGSLALLYFATTSFIEHREQAELRAAAPTPQQLAAQAEEKARQAELAAALERAKIDLATSQAKRDAQVKLAAVAAFSVREAMKDPEGFKLTGAVLMPDGTACFEYRATNSFGAFLRGHAMLTASGSILLEEQDRNAFVKAWNKHCAAPGGDRITEALQRLM